MTRLEYVPLWIGCAICVASPTPWLHDPRGEPKPTSVPELYLVLASPEP